MAATPTTTLRLMDLLADKAKPGVSGLRSERQAAARQPVVPAAICSAAQSQLLLPKATQRPAPLLAEQKDPGITTGAEYSPKADMARGTTYRPRNATKPSAIPPPLNWWRHATQIPKARGMS